MLTEFTGQHGPIRSIAYQSDQKFVVAGYVDDGTRTYVAIARCKLDGTLDAGFNANGKRVEVTEPTFYRATSVLATGYGLVVSGRGHAGMASDTFAILKYTAAGAKDAQFNGGHVLLTDVGSVAGRSGALAAVTTSAVQSDGKIVAVGNIDGPSDIALVRYTADGKLDACFGGCDARDGGCTAGCKSDPAKIGRVISGLSSNVDRATGMAIDANGQILVVGYTKGALATRGDLAVWRFNADGSRDLGFGSSGEGATVLSVAGRDTQGRGVAVTSAGTIVVVGASSVSGASGQADLYLARLDSTGRLDPAFGSAGTVLVQSDATDEDPSALALQSDGRILVAGSRSVLGDGVPHFMVSRFTSDGAADGTFGDAGTITSSIPPGAARAYDVVLQPDGRIVVAGGSDVGPGEVFATARFYGDATCGNGVREPGEACDGEACCAPGCNTVKGDSEQCGTESRPCHERPLCNGRDATCPTEPRTDGPGTTCFPDSGCTIGGCDDSGTCVPRGPVCGASAKVRRNGTRHPHIKVVCDSDTRTECVVAATEHAAGDGFSTAELSTTKSTCPGGAIANTITLKTRKRRGAAAKHAVLKYRTVATLALNACGSQLVRTRPVSVDVSVLVRQALHDARLVKLLNLLKARH